MIPQLIALDLDGTLLGTDGRVLPRTADVLEAAHQAGVLVVVATGRPLGRAKEITDSLPFVTHTVAANGSVIVDRNGTTTLFPLPRPAVNRAILTLRRHLPGVGFELVTEADAGAEYGFERFVQIVGHALMDDVTRVRGEQAVKLSVFHPLHSADDLLTLVPPLLEPGMDVIHSGLDFVEVGPPGLSKAGGLQWLCDQFGLDPTASLAFGDGPNDHEMLAWAGMGVAMENATDVTKRLADRVTASCDDDGIAEIVAPLLAQAGLLESPPHVELPGPVEARGSVGHDRHPPS